MKKIISESMWQPVLFAAFFASAMSSRAQTDTAKNRQVISHFFEEQAKVRYIYQTVLSPDGKSVAWSADKDGGVQISTASLSKADHTTRITAGAHDSSANESEPQWSPDGREIAFLSDARTHGQAQVSIASVATGVLAGKQPVAALDGYASHLKWSPDGKFLSILYVEKASREPSPMAPENKPVGLVDSMVNRNIQRIAVINRATGDMQQITPPNLYIFEYDWSPDSKRLAYTAAAPPGDDNWYIAQLFQQQVTAREPKQVYKPARQIAVPRWSPDGKRIAFIEGLMSDQGGTGGELFHIAADGLSLPQNCTPDRKSTPSWLMWTPDGNIIFSEFINGSVAINKLNVSTGSVQQLSAADESMRAGNEEMSASIIQTNASATFAYIRTSWTMYPEVWAGGIEKLQQITHLNTSMGKPPLEPKSIKWVNEGQQVQGWLLLPANYDPSKKYPMLVSVHGGPAWITTPTWSAPDFNSTVYPSLGYFVFFPNPRGSYGQGEKFTLANRRDWGFGDLRDIRSGVDTVIKKFSVERTRVGIYGWSYGGASAMFAVTQTDIFRAAVAGAGAADWLSYYGQNSIDKWMNCYFGVSPYDDPEAYRKCSAMTYIKNVKTPTLVLVGERDGESPPPQSLQFWHALRELHVPTQLMIYADEGHSFYKFENIIDVSVRTLEWFNTHMK